MTMERLTAEEWDVLWDALDDAKDHLSGDPELRPLLATWETLVGKLERFEEVPRVAD